jgi:hypothetical protein
MPENNPTPNGQVPNGTDPQGQVPTIPSNGQVPNEPPNIDALLAQIKELRAENAKHRTKANEQAQAAQAAEEARLKEQGQFKQLAEQHEARVKELEPLQGRYAELSQLVAGQIEAQIEEWPATVKVFDPGADAPIEQRLSWLEKSKPLIEQLQLQARANQPGNGPNPRPTQSTPDDARAAFERKLRASGKYGA